MSLKHWMQLDEKTTNAIRLKSGENRFKPVASFFAHSGDSWFIEIALFIIWLFSLDRIHQISALMAGCVLILALMVLGIKFTIRRPRPEGDWGAIYRNTDPHSFPSGHAARVAMLALLAFNFDFFSMGIVLAIWAFLVCLARIWMGVHYLSDILAGILLGLVFGMLAIWISPWLMKLLPWIFSNQTSLLTIL